VNESKTIDEGDQGGAIGNRDRDRAMRRL